jgi:16S rRNA processing protein RimM
MPAGRVGRPHGLDGSFHVADARSRLLVEGVPVTLDGRTLEIVRRAGTDSHPIVRLEGVDDRAAAEALRGSTVVVQRADAPALEVGEWWAEDLEGCEVLDGERRVGVVSGLLELPSCEALQVEPLDAPKPLLIPMVRDAIRRVDVAAGRIDVDMSFLEES